MEKICAVCGKKFWTTTTAKTCSPTCKRQWQHQTRKEWEIRTDFRGRSHAERVEYNAAQAARIDAENKAEQRRIEANRKRRQRYRRNKHRDALQAQADNGDPMARLLLAVPFSEDYFAALRDYELEYADSIGKECGTTVNGIPVTVEDFPLLAALSVEEAGAVATKTYYY